MRFLLALVSAAAFVAPPSPGPTGLEGVPVPLVSVLQSARSLHLGQKVDGIPCEAGEKLSYHVHTHLAIFVNGKQRQVPYGIGIGPPLSGVNAKPSPFVEQGTCIAWLHTHTADGIIHVEGPAKRSFTLGQFFDLWGAKLSSSQVGPAKGNVVALVGGKVWSGDPRAIPLGDKELVQLDVGSPVIGQQVVGFAKLS